MTQARPETAGAWMWRRPETGLRGASGRAARPAMGVGLSLNTRYYSTGLGGCQKGPNVSNLPESLLFVRLPRWVVRLPRWVVRQQPASERRAGDKRRPPLWRVLAFPAWLFASDPPANTGQAPGEDRRCGGFPPSPLGHSPAARQRTPSVRQRPASERRAGARRRPPLWRVSAFPAWLFANDPPANAGAGARGGFRSSGSR